MFVIPVWPLDSTLMLFADILPPFAFALFIGIFALFSPVVAQSATTPTSGTSTSGSGATTTTTGTPTPTAIRYAVATTYPHNPRHFTQGFEFISSDIMLESTGMIGESVLLKYNPFRNDTSVGIFGMTAMEGMFGEGSTLFAGKIWWWSWQNRLGYTYEPSTLVQNGNFTYESEGWGLTHNDTHIISTDGSDRLTFRDATFAAQGSLRVTEQGRPVRNLNELEYVDGGQPFNPGPNPAVLVNIWQTQRIVRVRLEDGLVDGYLDCTELVKKEQAMGGVDVLNGIATDSAGRLWVTGKYWHTIYVLVPRSGDATTSLASRSTTSGPQSSSRPSSGAASRDRRSFLLVAMVSFVAALVCSLLA
ncbi:glutamine cyclotransferase-domain-containing protein [Hyaloraphidium curvatum]|nr:glutamine cyclotransferase-domain-containing protein [Hyaloraphidium curvatum]